MRALPVHPEPLWRTDFRQRIAVSLWFLPSIFAVAAIVAANLTIWLDTQVDAPVGVRLGLVSDPGSAATFAAAIAAAAKMAGRNHSDTAIRWRKSVRHSGSG